MRAIAPEGRYLGGRPPYGYQIVGTGVLHPNPEEARQRLQLTKLAVNPETSAVVKRIFAWRGQGLGFRATVEKPVLEGQGSIDLLLEKPGHALACEINVTSTIDYEVGNVSKCLKAGFATVAVICPNANRLSRLAEAMKGCFGPELLAKIGLYSPDEFVAYLQKATLEQAPDPSQSDAPETRRRGYKVKRHFVELSPEEAKAREDSALKMIAEKMRRPPPT